MGAWLNLCRWKNLSIISITQVLVFFYLNKLTPGISIDQDSYTNFILLIFCTVLLAAGGFIINDLFDEVSDHYNKADTKIIGNKISFKAAQVFYILTVLTGNIIALLLSIRLNSLVEYFIYPTIVFLLWVYSYKLKCTPLAGNLFVSIFTSGVILIIPYAFRNEFNLISTKPFITYLQESKSILLMCLFTFSINFYREVVKDLEDLAGDKMQGCQTTAIYFGEANTRIISGIILLTHFILTILIIQTTIPGIILISIPALILFIVPYTSIGWNYTILSLCSKLYMILGLIYFLTNYHG